MEELVLELEERLELDEEEEERLELEEELERDALKEELELNLEGEPVAWE